MRAEANPTGGQVVNGQASFNSSGNTLTITNTPGTIINWQNFSINANEVTRFAQQSAASAVLNRVVTNNPSVILGTLSSNGQVCLVNANGIMFGAGPTVDVAGLVATTLNLSDADFLAGRHNYTAVPGAQNISNFGNICAGHIARMMGLPIGQLILATNENDVLDEFFRTGVYRPRDTKHTYETSSPSMDISKASNFERFVFDLVGRDAAKVREFWGKVDKGGSFDIKDSGYWNDLPKFHFSSGKSTHQDRLKTIRELWEEYGVMVDTHTADGLKVGLEQRRSGLPLICLETALPAKFAETIQEALGRQPERPAKLAGIENLPQRCEVMEADVGKLKAYISANVPA